MDSFSLAVQFTLLIFMGILLLMIVMLPYWPLLLVPEVGFFEYHPVKKPVRT